jgi:hypothetical protein
MGFPFWLWGRDEEYSRFPSAVMLCQVVILEPFTTISCNQKLQIRFLMHEPPAHGLRDFRKLVRCTFLGIPSTYSKRIGRARLQEIVIFPANVFGPIAPMSARIISEFRKSLIYRLDLNPKN